MKKQVFFLLFFLSFVVQAQEKAIDNKYITVNVGVDINGIERAAENLKLASSELSGAIRQLAENPELQPEQQHHLNTILQQLTNISQTFNDSIKLLPESIAATKEPITETTLAIKTEIRSLLITTAAILFALFAAAVFTIFWLVIRPSKRILLDTSSNFAQIATALEKTAALVEKTNKHYLDLDNKPKN